MADVFLAIQSGPANFNRLLALKVLRSQDDAEDTAELVRLFEHEARLAALLNHPNIVQTHDVGVDAGHHFIAMEYLEGQPLSRVQERCRSRSAPFSLEMQLSVLCQVLDGLEYAHQLRDFQGRPLHLVHRDVSPQNVFISYFGSTKLVDFGIAKTLESNRTAAGVVRGKAAYMSPEQALGYPIDHRSDLFSVGVILWEAIAQRRLHAGLGSGEIALALSNGKLPELRAVVPDVPEDLEDIVRRALACDPEERYPSAAAFRQDLRDVARVRSIEERDIGELVGELFDEERRAISEIVRNAVSSGDPSNGDAPPVSGGPASVRKLEAGRRTSVIPGRPLALAEEKFVVTETSAPVTRQLSSRARAASRANATHRRAWGVVAAAASLGGIIALSLLWRSTPPQQRSAAATSAQPVVAAPSVAHSSVGAKVTPSPRVGDPATGEPIGDAPMPSARALAAAPPAPTSSHAVTSPERQPRALRKPAPKPRHGGSYDVWK